MANDNQYRLILGTFIDNKFVWHDVDSFATLSEAYKEYKKYVNDQLKYTDEELVKVWNTGRLDIELLQGRRLLNWTGIYVREAAPDDDEDDEDEDDEVPEKEPAKPKDSADRLFVDERGEFVTEAQLREEFKQLKAEQPDEYDYSFEDYVLNCTGRNGTLTEIHPKRAAGRTDDARRGREWHTEDGDRVTEKELRAEFEFLKKRLPDEYDFDFEEYVKRCEDNGAIY